MQPTVLACPQCGRAVRASARFCPDCGAALIITTTISAPAHGPIVPASPAKPVGRLESGALIGPAGRYQIDHILGQGGFGAAYLAHDSSLGRTCVIKQLLLNPAWSEQTRRLAQASFAREAQLLVSLNAPGHPNIPDIYDYLADSECLVMKHIAGQGLDQVLQQRGGRLPEAEALRYAREACAALAYMHSRRPEPVLHRDIKPANILLDGEGRIWLIDFGLSKAIAPAAAVVGIEYSQTAGTLGYTPAEQWRGRAEPRSDVYALGATLHRLLTGHAPAQTDLLGLIQGAITLPPVREIVPEIRPIVENLIARAMAFDAADRPTAAELLAELDAILARPVVAPPPEPARPPEIGDFVGRATELARFAAELASRHVAVISGMAGVGKTALAVALARQHAAPDMIFWHTFHPDEGGEALIWALAGFLAWAGPDDLWQQIQLTRETGAELPPPEALCDYLVQLVRGKSYLLCFDDLHLAADEPIVQQLFERFESEARAGRVRLIVTIRQAPAFVRAAGEPLAGLDPTDARQLLEQRDVQLAADLADTVIQHTGGNVQLLLLICEALRHTHTPAAVVERLAEEQDIQRYLLHEVDDELRDDERAVMVAVAALLGYGGTRDAIEALLDPSDGDGARPADIYTRYETGLAELLGQLPHTHERYADALIYQQRLRENVGQARLYGDTENRRAERMEIGARLSELCLAALGHSFDDLCGPVALPTARRELGERGLNMRRLLIDLSDRHLLTIRQGEAGREYGQHAIVQAFYYEMPERRERLALHRRAGVYYEHAAPDALKAARHYLRAEEHARAAALASHDVWALVNAGHARPLRALLEQFTERQLDIEQWLAVCIARGEICTLLGASGAAQESYQQALTQLESLPDTPDHHERAARICRGMGELLEYEDPQRALEWLRRGLNELPEGSTLEEARLDHRLGSVLIGVGDYDAASAALDQSLSLLPSQHVGLRSDALTNLGVIACLRGDLERGKQYFLQTLALDQQIGNHWGLATTRQNLGRVMEITGDWAGAAAEYQQALDLAERLANVKRQAAIEFCLGILNTNQGQLEMARARFLKCLDLARTHNLREYIVSAQSRLADLSIRLGDVAAAASALDEARELAFELSANDQLPEIYRGQALMKLAHGQVAAAQADAERALESARELEDPLAEGVGLRVLGQALLAGGQPAEAQERFEHSLALLDGKDPYEVARTQAEWGRALLAGDNRERGLALLKTARATFTQLGAQRDLAAVEHFLAEPGAAGS